MAKVSLLFVCLGNICRSPTAHAVMESKLLSLGFSKEDVYVDSAGTYGGHAGEHPDPRARRAASERGYDMSHIRSRKIDQADIRSFDYIFAMDKSNLLDLRRMTSDKSLLSKIRMTTYCSKINKNRDIPDPYYDSESGFTHVISMIEEAAEQIIDDLILVEPS